MQAHMVVEEEDEGTRRGVTGGSDDEAEDKLGQRLKRETAEVRGFQAESECVQGQPCAESYVHGCWGGQQLKWEMVEVMSFRGLRWTFCTGAALCLCVIC